MAGLGAVAGILFVYILWAAWVTKADARADLEHYARHTNRRLDAIEQQLEKLTKAIEATEQAAFHERMVRLDREVRAREG